MSSDAAAPGREEFAVERTITTRWHDEDVYGHVNNVVYYAYFDTAVNGYLMDATGVDVRTLEATGIVAETSCRFLRELRFPLDVHAGLRVTRLGHSSVTYDIALFQGEDPAPAALGRFVHVYVSGRPRRSTEIPASIRAVLEPLRVPS